MTEIQPFESSSAGLGSTATATSTASAKADTPATKGVANLPEHRHCDVCGRSIPMGNRVCSPECQKRFDEALRARKRSVWIFIGLFALILILSLYGNQLGAIFGRA